MTAATPAAALLDAHGVTKSFRGGDGGEIRVLDGVDLAVAPGEMVAVVGASGSGKSTLLHVLGALERPSTGRVTIGGEDVSAADDDALSAIRNRRVGFVFQFHHLLKEFSALENVMMPLRIAGTELPVARERATWLLERVGLSARASHRPSEMSGGEQQRTAVARALATSPSVILADEPSGKHDLLAGLGHDLGLGVVVVTHNRSLAARANRVLLLADGRLADTTGIEGAV